MSLVERLTGEHTNTLSKASLLKALAQNGILESSPLFDSVRALINGMPDTLSEEDAKRIKSSDLFISRALEGDLVIRDFVAFSAELERVYSAVEIDRRGRNAQFIPQLREDRVDPEQWGVSVCSIDGQQWGKGDVDTFFSIQSVSKAITYAMILEEHGEEKVHYHIGREPSGVGFNERVLAAPTPDTGRRLPHNPCINSGAIMAASLVRPTLTVAERFDAVMDVWTRLCGGARPRFDNSAYQTERRTANRNFCLAYMMQEEGVFPDGTDLITSLELYFMFCSIQVTSNMLAVAASTLAGGGVCPVSGERVFSERTVRDTLSLVASCGMFDASGAFIFDVGFPSKSGAGGGLLVMVPGVTGIGCFSPRLDKYGNSQRGVRFCELLAKRFDFHQYSVEEATTAHVARHADEPMIFAAQRDDLRTVQACVALGSDINHANHDRRTVLHLAASEGLPALVAYLLAHGADRSAVDCFGNTPLDDARRACSDAVVAQLQEERVYARRYPLAPDASREVLLFAALDIHATGVLTTADVRAALVAAGYDDGGSKQLRLLHRRLGKTSTLDDAAFGALLSEFPLIANAVELQLTIPAFTSFADTLQSLYDDVAQDTTGENAQYIETLQTVNPDLFAVAFCSTQGQLLSIGDANESWCAQSTGKVVNYLIALDLLGEAKVHQHVGKEPSGRNFNALTLDHNNLPHNPVINAGAIMIVSLIKPEQPASVRFSYIQSVWQRLTGGDKIGFDNATFLAEAATATRNWTLAYMMLDAGAFDRNVKSSKELQEHVELYFMTCSLTITARQMAAVAATLANGGVNPLSGERVFQKQHVRNALSIMASAGMYDYSGEFSFRVGVPAKSGVSGAIMAAVPGVGGFCTFSPRLDSFGNSQRGVRFYQELTKHFNFHVYNLLQRGLIDPTLPRGNLDDVRCVDLLFAAYSNDALGINKAIALGMDASAANYDLRTALHIACAASHVLAVKTLLGHGANPRARDRWGKTPMDEAYGKPEIEAMLAAAAAANE